MLCTVHGCNNLALRVLRYKYKSIPPAVSSLTADQRGHLVTHLSSLLAKLPVVNAYTVIWPTPLYHEV